jgi:hypothetical protein
MDMLGKGGRVRRLRIAAVFGLGALALARPAESTLSKTWTIEETAKAPLLAVCTVVSGQQEGPPLEGSDTAFWTAQLVVRRVFSTTKDAPKGPRSGDTIVLWYLSLAAVENTGSGVLSGPFWPYFAENETALFPLVPDRFHPGQWSLIGEQGFNLTVPAVAEEWQSTDPSATPRGFIVHELANALAHGDPQQQFEAAWFLREGMPIPPELPRILESAVGTNEDRWLAVAVALLTTMGSPHPSVAQLFAGSGVDLYGGHWRSYYELAAVALRQGARRNFPDRLIRQLVRRTLVNVNGLTWLPEFKDSPTLIEDVRAALLRKASGSLGVAEFLAQNKQKAFLPEALGLATEILDRPPPHPSNELGAAGRLVVHYGDETLFERLLARLRDLQATNEEEYGSLWGSVDGLGGERAFRLDAVLIGDKRVAFKSSAGQDVRYCDLAASSVQRYSGKDFGVTPETVSPQLDLIVGRVAEWLKSREPHVENPRP